MSALTVTAYVGAQQIDAQVGGAVGPRGPQGVQGPTGDSAYEVAVENGFVGTPAEWLASLVGPEGPMGQVETIAEGTAVQVNDTDPNNPIVSVPLVPVIDDDLVTRGHNLGREVTVDGVTDQDTATADYLATIEAVGGDTIIIPRSGVVASPELLSSIGFLGMGRGISGFLGKAGSTKPGVVTLDDTGGPISRPFLRDLQIRGDLANTDQWGMYIEPTADPSSPFDGGLWYGTFGPLTMRNHKAGDIWLRGGGDSNLLPHQFLSFRDLDCRAPIIDTDRAALRITGQVGQTSFYDCEFTGANGSADDMGFGARISREVDDDGDVISDESPYEVNFYAGTFQGCVTGADIDRANGVAFWGTRFENNTKHIRAGAGAKVLAVNCKFVGQPGDDAVVAHADGAGTVILLINPLIAGSSYAAIPILETNGGKVHIIGESTLAQATTEVIATRIGGDTGTRAVLRADGRRRIGPGDGTFDVEEYRSGNDELTIEAKVVVSDATEATHALNRQTGDSRYGSVIVESHADTTVVNSTAETDLFSLAVPANVLAAGDLMVVEFHGYTLNNSGGNVNFTPRFYFGSAAVVGSSAVSVASGASRRYFHGRAVCYVESTTAQRWSFQSRQTAGVAAGGMSAYATNPFEQGGHNVGTQDTSSARNARLTIQMGTADANAQAVCTGASVVVFKKRS